MEINNLATALCKAQSEMQSAHEGGYNPHFKSSFATLTDLINATRPSLTKYGLSVTQYPNSDQGDTFLVTELMHSSGERITSKVKMVLDKPSDIQSFGKTMTYLKRYAYAAIVGATIGDEEDDDGNSISVRDNSSQPDFTRGQSVGNSEFISPKQLALLRMKLPIKPEAEKALIDKFGSLEKIPWKQFNDIIGRLDPSMKKDN